MVITCTCNSKVEGYDPDCPALNSLSDKDLLKELEYYYRSKDISNCIEVAESVARKRHLIW